MNKKKLIILGLATLIATSIVFQKKIRGQFVSRPSTEMKVTHSNVPMSKMMVVTHANDPKNLMIVTRPKNAKSMMVVTHKEVAQMSTNHSSHK